MVKDLLLLIYLLKFQNCIIELIKKCWHSNPNERPTINEIIFTLQLFLCNDINDNKLIQKYVSLESLKPSHFHFPSILTLFSDIQYIGYEEDDNCLLFHFIVIFNDIKFNLFMYVNKLNDDLNDNCCLDLHGHLVKQFHYLSTIQHPHLICLFDSFQCIPSIEIINSIDDSIRNLYFMDLEKIQTSQFYVLQHFDVTLHSILSNLHVNHIMKYSTQLALILSFLYEQKFIYFDISLDNLMISSYDDLILKNSKFIGELNDKNHVSIWLDSYLNDNHTIYLSPEVLCAYFNGNDLLCDLQHSWALGIIMFQMFTDGKLPFQNYGPKFSFAENPLDLSNLPGVNQKVCRLIGELLCPCEDRISIEHAKKSLLTLSQEFNKDFL